MNISSYTSHLLIIREKRHVKLSLRQWSVFAHKTIHILLLLVVVLFDVLDFFSVTKAPHV